MLLVPKAPFFRRGVGCLGVVVLMVMSGCRQFPENEVSQDLERRGQEIFRYD